jgi:hypothetical protein
MTALHAPPRAVVAHRAYPTDRLRRNPQSARVAADYGYGLRQWADFTARPRSEDRGMSLIERSPGGFVFVANVVLYTTVLLETLMLVTGSPLFMVGVLALIVAVAGLLCRFILNLMGTEAYTLGEEEPETAAPAQAEPAVAPAPQRRPARVVSGAPILH